MVRALCLFLGLSLFVAAIVMGGNLFMFVNMPSALIVVGGGLLMTMGFHGVAPVGAAIAMGWGGSTDDRVALSTHVHVLQTLRDHLLASAGLGTLIGFVQMLANLSDPSAIGPAVAVALLCLLYGLLLAELMVAGMIRRLAVQLEGASGGEAEQLSVPTSARGAVTMMLAAFTTLGIFAVLTGALTAAA